MHLILCYPPGKRSFRLIYHGKFSILLKLKLRTVKMGSSIELKCSTTDNYYKYLRDSKMMND